MATTDALRQCFFIPTPPLTEKNLPDQTGRVLLVTGGYAGVGKELCNILYSKNGTVYLAGRSAAKANAAIAEIKANHPSSTGTLAFLNLDLSDLSTIKPAAEAFLSLETRLDVLTNNAGVMIPPANSQDAHGHELQLATNCLGPYLFTQLLTPLLEKTAASAPPGSVRVTWAASLATMFAPPAGVAWDEATQTPKWHPRNEINYAQSKAGNVLLAHAYQRQVAASGVVSNAWNPGNLISELHRHTGWLAGMVTKPLLYPTVFGAYTELFAGWGEEAGREERKGAYIVPWGRFGVLRKDLEASATAARFSEWCEKETKSYR